MLLASDRAVLLGVPDPVAAVFVACVVEVVAEREHAPGERAGTEASPEVRPVARAADAQDVKQLCD